MFDLQRSRAAGTAGGRKRGSGVAALLGINILFGFAQASNEYRVLFLENMGLSATQCGQILAAAGLLAAFSRPLSGGLADKLRSRRVVYIGALLSWIAVLVLMLLTRNVRIAGFFLCAGIVPLLSVSEPAAYGMVEASGVHAAARNSRVDYSLIRVCLSVGYSAINFLYTPIVSRFGPTAPFCCTVVYAAVMLAISGTLRRFENAPAEGRSAAFSGEKLRVGRLFQNYFLITFILLTFLYAISSHTQYYLPYLLEAVGLDRPLVGVASGIRVAGEILVMPFLPLVKRWISLPMLQVVAGAFVALQMGVYLVGSNPYVILGAILFSGMASGITLCTTAVYLRRMAPEGLDNTTLSLSSVMLSLGDIIIALAGGVVVDALGVFTLYRVSLGILLLWFVLYFGVWAFGVHVLKKTPPVPMFVKKARRQEGSEWNS